MRRVISLMLSVLMVFGMIPASAFAAAPAPTQLEQTEVQTPLEIVEESGGAELKAQASINGVTVTVDSPADAFPAGTVVTIRPVRGTALAAYSDVVLANMENGSVMAAFDITFSKDGEELQPKDGTSVDVRFTTDYDGERDFSVWHVDDKATEAEPVSAEKTTEDNTNILDVKATEFSVYVLASVQSTLTTYRFHDEAGAEISEYEQIVKPGDVLVAPEIPDKDEHHIFTGWHIGSDTGAAFDSWDSPASAADSVDLYPAFEEVYYIFFMEKAYEAASVFLTQTVKGDAISSSVELISTDHYKSQTGGVDYFFKDWYYDAGLSDKVTGSTVDLEHGTPGTKHDIYLYPERISGYWLYFDSGEGTYREPTFVSMDSVTVAPAEPTCPGYIFVRWSETPGGSAYAFGTPLTCDKTLYAVWAASSTTNYTLVHWLENADNDNYSFYKAEVKKGTTGSTVTAVGGTLPTGYASTGSLVKNSNGFIVYDSSNKPQYQAGVFETGVVAGDGSTIINVYYKRAEYQVKFYSASNALINELTITAKYGSYIGDQWPSWRSGLSKTYGANWRTTKSGSVMQAGISVMPLNGTSFWEITPSGNDFNIWFYTDYDNGSTKTLSNGGKTWYYHHVDNFKYNASSLSITKEDHYDIDGYTWTGGIAKNGSSLKKGTEGVTFLYTRNEYDVNYLVYDNSTTTYKQGTVKYKFKDAITGIENKNPHDITSDVNADGTRTIGGAIYEFRGWFDNKDGYGEPITSTYFANSTMPSHTITLYACYKKKEVVAEVNLKIHTSSDTDPHSYTVPAGTSVAENIPNLQDIENELMSLKSDGTTWIGWEREVNGEYSSFNIKTLIYEDTRIYPAFIFGGELYVTYDLNGGTGTAPGYVHTFLSGSHAKVLAPTGVTAPTGKYFLGWSYNGNTYYPGNALAIGESDIILTAVWGEKPATTNITYYANDGTTTSLATGPFKINETTTAKAIGDVVGSSYGYPAEKFFFGWSSTPTGAAEYMAGEEIIADNKNASGCVNELYARWYEPLEITVTAPSLTVAYDGEAHTVSGIEKTVKIVDPTANVETTAVATFSAGTVSFEYNRRTFEFSTVTCSRTETSAGTYTVKATGPDFVYDPYTSKMLAITYIDGSLVIGERNLVITGSTETKSYTGSPISITNYTAVGLMSGHKLTGLTYAATGTEKEMTTGYPGVFYENSSPVSETNKIVIYDASDNDVTANYNIVVTPGTLFIRNSIEVTVELKGYSSETVYNGATQTVSGYEAIVKDEDGNVLDTQLVTAVSGITTTVSGMNAGTYTMPAANPADIHVTLEQGYELKENGVTFTPGTLTISKATLTITGASATATYTGKEISLDTYSVIGLCSGDTISSLTYSAKGTNNGTYGGSFNKSVTDLSITNSSGSAKDSYNITMTPGSLVIQASGSKAVVNFVIHYQEAGTGKTLRGDEYKAVEYSNTKSLSSYGCNGWYEIDFDITGQTIAHPSISGYTYSSMAYGTGATRYYKSGSNSANVGTPVAGHYYVTAESSSPSTSKLDTSNGEGGSKEVFLYYTKDTVTGSYVIEFYYDGVQDTALTKTGTVNVGSTINATNYESTNLITANCRDGYLFRDNHPTSITVSENKSENYIRIDYVRDNSKYAYTVEYYYDGVLGDSYTCPDSDKLRPGEVVSSYPEKPKTGYTLSTVTGAPLTITTTEANNLIKLYYVKGTFSYRVNFYKDSQLDTYTTDTATYGATISAATAIGTYTPGEGYILQETPASLTITEISASNVINVYYVKRSDLGYTVTYTLSGTTTALAAPKNASNLSYGTQVTETALSVPGYQLVSGCNASQTITVGTGTNAISFVYEMRSDLGYTVRYLNKKDSTPLETEEVETGKNWLETYSVSAKDIDNYIVDSAVKTVKVSSEDASENVVTFYYQEKGTGQYTINYYLYGTTDTVRVASTVTGKTVGNTVSITPEEVSGYTIAPNTVSAGNDTVRSLEIKDDASQNVVNFYYLKNLIIAADSMSVEYDGQSHTVDTYKVTDASGTEVSGITGLSGIVVDGATGTARGSYDNHISAGPGKGYIAPYYFISAITDGKLVITERTIIVKSASATQLYNGTALTSNTFTITDADGETPLTLMDGHKLSAHASGSQTDVGSSENTIDYVKIVEEVGEADVSENYKIIAIPGALTVNPTVPGLIVTAKDYTGTYDAAEHKGSDQGFTFTFNGDKATEFSAKYDLVPTFAATSTIIHTGSVANVIDSIAVYDKVNDPGHTKDLIGNFDYQLTAGTLTVNPVEITIVAESSSTTDLDFVDGTRTLTATTLSGNSYGYKLNGTAGKTAFPIASEAEFFTVTVTGSQTGVGSTESVVSYTFAGAGEGPDIYMADYYIEATNGVLEVINEEETITYEKPYDGVTVTTGGAISLQGSVIKVVPGSGTWTNPDETILVPVTGNPNTYKVMGDADLGQPTPPANSIFTGWATSTESGTPVYTATYETDILGGTDPADPAYLGDGIPDKYQFTVTFQVVHGSWTSTATDTADKTYVLTQRDTDGKWSTTGTANLTSAQIPTGMQAAEGYYNGAWDTTPSTTDDLDADTTYVYTFVIKPQTVTYDDNIDPEVTDPTPVDVNYFDEIKVVPGDGTWTTPANLEAVTGKTDTYAIKGDVDLGEPIPPANKIFTGWTLTTEGGTKVFTATYETDTLGGTDPADPAYPGDGIPDKYQFKVTFKIVKGRWTDTAGDSADKVCVLTMKDTDGKWSTTGTAKLSSGQIPATTAMKADTGYGDGAWDVDTPSTSTALSAEKTYTYKFVPLDQDVKYQKPVTSGADPEQGTDHIKYDSNIKVNPGDSTVCASWTAPTTLEPVSGKDNVYTVKGGVTLGKPVPQDGVIFIGWEVTTDAVEGIPLYSAKYETDVLGGTDPGDPKYPGDGIPDKYQFKVTFKIVKGSWSSDASDIADKTCYLTRVDGTGKWDNSGSAKLAAAQIPGSMQAFTGYGNGAWDVTPSTTTALNAEVTYTFTYTANAQTVTYDDDVDPNAADPTPEPVHYDDEIKVIPGEGTWTNVPATTKLEEVPGKDDTYAVKGDVVLGEPTAPDGKIFTGWTLTEEGGTKVFTATYETDALGATDPVTGLPTGDGIPDKYQFLVTFNIVKGSWSSDASDIAAKTFYLTKVDGSGNWDETGSAKLTAAQIPSGMQSFTGYGNGAWNVTPSTTSGIDTETTYIYTFVADAQTVTYDDSIDPGVTDPAPLPVHYDDEVKVIPGEGTWTNVPATTKLEEVPGKDDTYAVKGEVVLGEPTAPDGKIFTGWTLTEEGGTKVFTATYETDTIGATDPVTGLPTGDGIPDKFQKTVTFDIDVAKGTWSDDTSTTITEYITLFDGGKWSEAGKGQLTAGQIPTGMKALEGYDQTAGTWGTNVPQAGVDMTDDATYSYTFGPASYAVNLVPGPGAIKPGKDVTTYTHDTDKSLPGADDMEYEGYIFDGWFDNDQFSGDPVTTIPGSATGAKTFYAKWSPKPDTPYTVKHFKADSKGEYAATPDDTDNLLGFTDQPSQAVAKDYEGFSPVTTGAKAWSQVNVTGDGLAVVNIYYERKTYEAEYSGEEDGDKDGKFDPIKESGLRYEDRIVINPNGGNWTAPAGWTENAGKYETTVNGSVEIADPTHDTVGEYFYTFGGWDKAETTDPVTGVKTLELTALWIKVTTEVNVEVKIAAELEGEVVADKKDLESLAHDELMREIANQGSKRISELDITMTVTSVETVSQQQATVTDQLNAIREIAQNRNLEFFEIVINKQVRYMTWNGSAWVETSSQTTPITETADPIAITLPYNTYLKQNLAVYRFHEGDGACEFGETPNAAGEYSEIGVDNFTVHASKFSIYAIGYYIVSTEPDTRSATVTLTDNESGEPIKGAVFNVCLPDGTVLGTAQTDANGKVRFEGLLPGDYYIVETKAPSGYVTDPTKLEFTVFSFDASFTMGNDRAAVPAMLNGTDHYAYVFGYTDGTVRPENNISRAEVAAIFYRLLKPSIREASKTDVCSYSDIKGDEWYATEVATMTALGILSGYPDGSFKPNAPITRAELATVASKFSDFAGEVDSTFTDIEGIWAETFVNQSATLGWVTGYEDNTFRPGNYITRAEAISLINNVLQRRPETADDLMEGKTEWPDNADESQWYYTAIEEATTSHNYEAKGQGYETWTEVLPGVTIFDAQSN